MKKLIATLLVGVMSLSLIACGAEKETKVEETKTEEVKTDETQETTETAQTEAVEADITLWTYPIGKFADSETVNGFIASFNEKNPGINVSVEYLDYTSGDDQVTAAIEAGTTPPCFSFGTSTSSIYLL